MLKHHSIKCNSSDIVSCASACVTAIIGTHKEVLIIFKSVSGAIVELRTAIRTENLSGKDAYFTRSGRSALMLSDFLYRIKKKLIYLHLGLYN